MINKLVDRTSLTFFSIIFLLSMLWGLVVEMSIFPYIYFSYLFPYFMVEDIFTDDFVSKTKIVTLGIVATVQITLVAIYFMNKKENSVTLTGVSMLFTMIWLVGVSAVVFITYARHI